VKAVPPVNPFIGVPASATASIVAVKQSTVSGITIGWI
jgi:hypothetical protein